MARRNTTFRLNVGREQMNRRAQLHLIDQVNRFRNYVIEDTPVDTGRLVGSIAISRIAELHYRVGTNVNYAPYVEFGTRYMQGYHMFAKAFARMT